MKPTSAFFAVIILLFGFLTGSTFYYYNRTRSLTKKTTTVANTDFQASIPEIKNVVNEKVDAQTAPAEPRGRLSYPANVYKVQPKESLFAIGERFGMPWQLIKRANGLTDENAIQADLALAIPKVDPNTDFFRLNFVLNEEKIGEMNRELRETENSEWFDATGVAKKHAVPYFGIKDSDNFRLAEADLGKGTAVVEVKNDGSYIYLVGLIQPKTKGEKGLWTVFYIEEHEAK